VNLYFSVVADESLFPEFVHEKTHPGSGRTDHFRERFLTESDGDWRSAAFLAEISEKQKQPRQASFAGIEKLVDQIVFDPAVPRQWLVAARNLAPLRHPSPKNCPSAKIPTTASLPSSDKTVSLTLPSWMKNKVSATSPWLKIFWFLAYRSMVFPVPARARKARGSSPFSKTSVGDIWDMVLLRYQPGSTKLSIAGKPARHGDGAI
jgi:hypothetical protein